MKYSLALIASFLAGYGAALLGASQRSGYPMKAGRTYSPTRDELLRAGVQEVPWSEVERRTRPNLEPMSSADWERLNDMMSEMRIEYDPYRVTTASRNTWSDPEYLNPDKAGA